MLFRNTPAALIAVLMLTAHATHAESGADFFEKQVRPLLAARCTECHGPKKQESGLRLDNRAAILRGGDRGASAAPNDMNSLLLTAVRGKDDDLVMPPDEKPLSPAEIAILEKWVKASLPWGETASPAIVTVEQRIVNHRGKHWAYQHVAKPQLPAVSDPSWQQTGVDAFVLSRLDNAGISPSPQVTRRQLIRRATFDLTGIPPTVAEVTAFVEDKRPNAYQLLIERLLASPRYGERWGRHWLDVARYADTQGYGFGGDRRYPYAYTYRNYVIDAFNADKPFNQFVVEQLAADQLGLPGNASELAALGFLTVGREYKDRALEIDDQIDVATRGFLGLTVACARCHDHKYDAIPAADYYSLYGVFASSTEPAELPVIGNPERMPGHAAFQQGLDKHQAALDGFLSKALDTLIDSSRKNTTDYLVRVISKKPAAEIEKLPFLKLKLEAFKGGLVNDWKRYIDRQKPSSPLWGAFKEFASASDADFAQQANQIRQRWLAKPRGDGQNQINPALAATLEKAELKDKLDVARLYGTLLSDTYTSYGKAPRDANGKPLKPLPAGVGQILDTLVAADSPTSVVPQELGRHLDRAQRNEKKRLESKILAYQVESPGAPPRAMVVRTSKHPFNPRIHFRGDQRRPGAQVPRQFLAVLSEQRQPYADDGRLKLARTIASPDNPLTARVIVNRLWMHHFGEPLVDTPADFGIRSNPPSHPLLLDYLASGLIDHNWSLKWLHREVMLSATYQQQSVDRSNCREVDPENRLLWRMNRRRLEFEALRDSILAVAGQLDTAVGGRPVKIFNQPFSHRRAVYGWIDRQDLPGLLRSFDFASPDQPSPRRPRTTSPQQALFFMNAAFTLEQANALATAIPAGADAERVSYLYQRLFARKPSAAEIQAAVEFIQAAGAVKGDKANLAPWAQYAHLLLLCNEFIYID